MAAAGRWGTRASTSISPRRGRWNAPIARAPSSIRGSPVTPRSGTAMSEARDHLAPRHVFLVDGSGFIFRAYHALPPLTRSDGTPTSAVLGFSNMLAKLLSETDADHIAVIFDHSGKSFRNQIYDQYKAHRPDAPDDLKPQFAMVRHATDAFSVCRIELENYEADDLIAAASVTISCPTKILFNSATAR